MARRIHTSTLGAAGELTLSEREAHHARDVLRLGSGDVVELFDDAGATARGTILTSNAGGVVVQVEQPSAAAAVDGVAVRLTVAAAVPKGDRAEWMIEKLSELGVARFIPLATARSVVLPAGKNKHERWTRIATEAAKQSRRRGVMRIDELTDLEDALSVARGTGACRHLSTTAGATSAIELVAHGPLYDLTAFVGPEGGWTDEEIARFEASGATSVKLTSTILRVETAAVALASIVGSVARRP